MYYVGMFWVCTIKDYCLCSFVFVKDVHARVPSCRECASHNQRWWQDAILWDPSSNGNSANVAVCGHCGDTSGKEITQETLGNFWYILVFTINTY